MDPMTTVFNLAVLISNELLNAEKLPAALISCGVVQAAAALCLIISKAPGGIFLNHGTALFNLYLGILISVLIFGLVQAWTGFWVSGNINERRAAGKTIMCLSILPLIIVAAFGSFAILNVK